MRFDVFLVVGVVAWSLVGCQPSEQHSKPTAQQEPARQDQTPRGQATTAQSRTVATGRFVSKGGQETSGTYRIVRTSGDLRLMFTDDFATDDGPDLHVVLTPTEATTASGENVMADGAALTVAPLGSGSGAQEFDLLDDLDLNRFKAVLIHCVQYSHLYGAAPL